MRKMAISLFAVMVSSQIMHASGAVSEELCKAYKFGAEAKLVYQVVDDEGVPVSNAMAHVWFRSYGREQDNADWLVQTDTNGVFVAAHRLNEKFSCLVYKEGYYQSRDERSYFDVEANTVKDGKWQPYGEKRMIVLKRIRNPTEMSVSEGLTYYKYPPQGKWTGFDLCKRDWIYPNGRGEFSDVLIRIGKKVTADGYVKTMEVAFTNTPFAGAYEMKEDVYSDFRSVYEANTNAPLSRVFMYTFKRGSKGNERKELNEGEYLVFRTRTKVDPEGNLLSAHYGMLSGNWRFCEKGGMAIERILFNQVPNDPNLEAAGTVWKSKRDYEKLR